jgi:signal peptidase I
VIALAGETVEIKDNTVYIDGEKLEEDYLVDGLRYDDYAAVCVPEGCIFVMGDNRPYSLDSRSSSVGFIRDENTSVAFLPAQAVSVSAVDPVEIHFSALLFISSA